MENIKKITEHTYGTHIYMKLEIDGKEYSHYRKKYDDYEGLKNKEVVELLEPLREEARQEWKKKHEL